VLARLAGACTPVAFQQFFHWVLMQNLSKYTTEVNCMPSYFYSYLRPYFHLLHRNSTGPDDQWRELHFKLVAEIIDNIVPDLAPDLFRLVDINDDGTITAEEWAKCHTLLLKPEPRALIGLLFKLLVCMHMTHVHICVCTGVYIYISMIQHAIIGLLFKLLVCIYTRIYIHAYTYTNTYTNLHIQICVYIYKYIYKYAYTYTNIRMHTCMHTYMSRRQGQY